MEELVYGSQAPAARALGAEDRPKEARRIEARGGGIEQEKDGDARAREEGRDSARLCLQVLPRVPHEQEAEAREDERTQDVARNPVLEDGIERLAEVELLEKRRFLHVENRIAREGDERNEHPAQRASRHETGGVKHARRQLALLFLVRDLLDEPLHHAADPDRERGRTVSYTHLTLPTNY